MPEPLTIPLNTDSRNILKAGFVFRAGFILIFVIGSALMGIQNWDDSVIFSLICFVISFGLALVFFRILNAAFFQEYLIVTDEDITVVRTTVTASDRYSFELDKIKYLGFADQAYTKHAMDNPIVDITGLATQEKELQYVIDEGNIKLETDSGSIKFGKNMPSWDVEELVEKIENHTGRKFNRPVTVNEGEEWMQEGPAEPEQEAEVPEEPETNEDTNRYNYKGDYGVLEIEQKGELPAVDDRAYLNGVRAPNGKYEIGEKQSVFVSNGIIYAVRL